MYHTCIYYNSVISCMLAVGSDFTSSPTGQPTSNPTGRATRGGLWDLSSDIIPTSVSPLFIPFAAAWSSTTSVVMVGQDTSINGGIIAYSADSGATFTTLQPFISTFFVDADARVISSVAYYIAVSQYGKVYTSTTPGTSWTVAYVFPANTVTLSSVTFASNNQAYIAGNLISNNQAYVAYAAAPFNTWTAISPAISIVVNINSIRTYNGVIIVIIGDSGTIVRTANSGSTWSLITSNTTASLATITGYGVNNYFVGGFNGVVLRSTNSGASFNAVPKLTSYTGLNSANNPVMVSTVSDAVTYVGGPDGTLIVTYDNGHDWSIETTLGISSVTGSNTYQALAMLVLLVCYHIFSNIYSYTYLST